jgi:putative ABC transport system substrate-binding protein
LLRITALGLVVALVGVLACCAYAPAAQTPTKIPRVGYLQPSTGGLSPNLGVFRQELRELGYVEGRNISIEYPAPELQDASLAARAADLVAQRVDVIFAVGWAAARAAKAATATTPIVALGMSADPVAVGLVASLARPGGNLTGLFIDPPELSGKELELLTEALPAVSRVAVICSGGHPAHAPVLKELDTAARVLGVQLEVLPIAGADDIEGAIAAAVQGHADALIALHDPLTFIHRAEVGALASEHGLPVVYEFRDRTDAEGLFAYGPSLADAYRRTARYVDRILRGAKPGELPVEQPTRFELVVNLKTARALGVAVSPAVLAEADNVIQ